MGKLLDLKEEAETVVFSNVKTKERIIIRYIDVLYAL